MSVESFIDTNVFVYQLERLGAVSGDNAGMPPGDLRDCLNAIRDAQQELEADDRFVRLREYLRQYDQG